MLLHGLTVYFLSYDVVYVFTCTRRLVVVSLYLYRGAGAGLSMSLSWPRRVLQDCGTP